MDRVTHQLPRQRGYGSTSSLKNDSLKHTRKHKRKERGIELRSKAARHWRTVPPGGADCPHRSRRQSGQEPRTVRPGDTDSPARSCGQSVKANITTRDEPGKTDCPRGPGGLSAPDPNRPLLNLGPSANRLQQKPKTKPDQKRRRARTRRTREEHCTHGLSARDTRTIHALQTEAKTARPHGSTPPTHHRISQMVEAEETRVWGQDMHQTRMLYPKNFAS
jgi:hypothetical protein